MRERIRIVLADDHPLFRAGVLLSLERTGRFEIVGEASDSEGALESVEKLRPDLVLVDLFMPTSGLEAVRRIREVAPEVKVVVLTASDSDEDIIASLGAGAKAYVLKGIRSVHLGEVIDAVMRGESYVPPAQAARIITAMDRSVRGVQSADHGLQRLTDREGEVLELVAGGLSDEEIGFELDLDARTIEHHMARVLDKLDVRSRMAAVAVKRNASGRA